MTAEEQRAWQLEILRLDSEGKISRTFRRLDPHRQMQVIEALMSEAAEHGADAVNVKQVARRAGVSVGSLYQYFPNRGRMLEFAAELCARFLAGSLDSYRPLLGAMPLREGLRAYLSSGVEWSQGYATLLGFFAKAAYHGVPGFGESLVVPVATAIRSLLQALLDGAERRGELREGLDVSSATRIVNALTIAVGDAQLLPHLNDYLQLFDDEHSPERITEALVDFVVRSISRAEA